MVREKKITCAVLWQNSVLAQQSSPGWDGLRINMWQVGSVFYEPCPRGWENPGSTGGISDWCEVVRLWWGSEPSFTLLLSHKGEVPVGREQLAGRHMPTYKHCCILLTRLSPCVRDPSEKEALTGSQSQLSLSRAGEQNASFMPRYPLSTIWAATQQTQLLCPYPLPAFIWNLRKEEVKVNFNQLKKTQ